ncbi:virulence protein RhuM/Fic/DOC family protein [Brevibacterium marinum]|uniref:Prophage maintenance system killer protein n=1 Tax=Brevibacterium marinum TaxID=418643 RepID=A0A846RZU8_9MICO|nr:virulence protein RhuM/Fic/DOC family protein [Brevibacterium marinum]NJC57476.1 prophage maintenance system killer protein [Brevibacterium marinum]
MSDSIEIFQSNDGGIQLDVRTSNGTVWLTRHQLATLYGRDVKTIGKHIANAQREELAGTAVVAKFATTASDGKTYQVEHYDLDMVLSVGYRVKSAQGVRFRRWANDVLRRYALEGAALNERRLSEIGKIVTVLARSDDELLAGVADVLSDYMPSLALLRDFDEGTIDALPAAAPAWTLTLDEARSIINRLAAEFPNDRLLGHERGDALDAVVGAIYQGIGEQELYPTVEEKAANLLYFVVKDHPLADGNKRSAAALFITFLDHNNALLNSDGSMRIAHNALAAITLLVAMSDPTEKDLMIALIIRMIVPETQ